MPEAAQVRVKLCILLAVLVLGAFVSMESVPLLLPLAFILFRWPAPLYGLAVLYVLVGLLFLLLWLDPFHPSHAEDAHLFRAAWWCLGDAAFSVGAALWIAKQKRHAELVNRP
jgi:hypothetical protein